MTTYTAQAKKNIMVLFRIRKIFTNRKLWVCLFNDVHVVNDRNIQVIMELDKN
jgi:hypothetical protein